MDGYYKSQQNFKWVRAGFNIAADGWSLFSGMKAAQGSAQAGKGVIKSIGEGIKALFNPGIDLPTLNLTICRKYSGGQSFFEKAKGFLCNFIPFKGSYDSIKKANEKSTIHMFEN